MTRTGSNRSPIFIATVWNSLKGLKEHSPYGPAGEFMGGFFKSFLGD